MPVISISLSPRAVTLTAREERRAAAPPVSVHQCQLSVLIHATCQCSSVPHFSAHQCYINATYQCSSELPFSVTHQCQSVPPINASQCHLS
ncbi:unnamed protein product, partial [Staurois parvus]